MTEITSFFLTKSPEEHLLYAQIRDDRRRDEAKKQIESFWLKYQCLKSHNFQQEAQINFYQRWWEMFLAVGLLNLGFDVKTDKDDKGPDIKLILPDDQLVWVEAVAPNTGNTTDAVPPLITEGVEGVTVSDLPEREFLLRLNKALEDKLTAFKDYIRKGLINKDGHCVIALSSCALAQYGDLMDFPVPSPLKVLAGCGQLVLHKSGNYIAPRNCIRASLSSREEEIDVDTRLFVRDDFSMISAVLYSYTDILNSPNNPESSFQLFFNPRKPNPILMSVFNQTERWFQESKKEGETIWTQMSNKKEDAEQQKHPADGALL